MALETNANILLGSTAPLSEVIATGSDAALTESELSLAVAAALRRALTAKYFATLDADGQLRSDLQAVCRAAKRQNMRVEYLIIAFKDAWRSLPEARMLPQGSQGIELLNRIITLCIAEFYASGRAD
jgi:hypothetical protein